jgi:RHS repeat-associated protein
MRLVLTGPAPPVGAEVGVTSSDESILWLPYSGYVVPSGNSAIEFSVGNPSVPRTSTVTLTASYGGVTKSADLIITIPAATLSGVAPGWVLPGDTTPVLYGTNLETGSTVSFTGPVYTLTDSQTALCTIGTNCPVQSLPGTANADFTALGFAIPPSAQPGIYFLKTMNAAGIVSTNNKWVAVDSAQQTRAAVPANQKMFAKRIYPGQTITGDFIGNNPTDFVTDYDFYYFAATAGSRVSLSLERVDASVPWENPASLDPQLAVIAPDGYIYGNLFAEDNQPGTDLNASLTSVTLPLTGLYIVAAETTRGSGAYRLSFTVHSLAPVSSDGRLTALSGNGVTLPVGTSFTISAAALDPRGWPLGGAGVSFQLQNGADDRGQVLFTPNNQTTSTLDGVAQASATFTVKGKIQLSPAFDDPLFTLLVAGGEIEALAVRGASGPFATDESAQGEGHSSPPLERFRPMGRRAFSVVGSWENSLLLDVSPQTRIPLVERQRRFERRPDLKGRAAMRSSASPEGPSAKAASRLGPVDASRLPTFSSRDALAITTCSPATFSLAGIDTPAIRPPFTVTLTDISPPTGVSQPLGEIGSGGITGYRIEKTVKLRIDIKDADGLAPAYPVLVALAVGGPRHGQVILDPEGTRITCDKATFLWHEYDQNGNVTQNNEVFEYTLGTLSTYVGAEPDPNNPGHVRPVWGEAESLTVGVATFDQNGVTLQSARDIPVHLRPAKPDHFKTYWELIGQSDDNTFEYWADHETYPQDGRIWGGPLLNFNVYYLLDRYDNQTFGYTGTQQPLLSPNIFVTFKDQTAGLSGLDGAFDAYEVDVSWNDQGGMPSGLTSVPLTLNYLTDPDWGAGSVTKTLVLKFVSGTMHDLDFWQDYDGPFEVYDGGWPITVSPGATGAALPMTSAGDHKRRVFLAITGPSMPAFMTEPFQNPHKIWRYDSGSQVWLIDRLDPQTTYLEVQDQPSFRLSVVDSSNKPVTDVDFQVHLCPRFDHEGPPIQTGPGGLPGRPCTLPPVDSINGVIDGIEFNSPYPAVGADDPGSHRGYFGIEPLQAPTELGIYLIDVEAIGNTYRIRREADMITDTSVVEGDSKGAFLFLNVDNRPDPDCRCGDAECGFWNCAGSPVLVGSGVYTTSATDLTLPTAGFPLSIGRRYFSSSSAMGLHGPGWRSNLEAKLVYRTTQYGRSVILTLPTGQQLVFTYSNADGPFTPPLGRKDTLIKNPDGTFDLTLEKSRSVYRFDGQGRLARMTDEFANAIDVTYNASNQVQRLADQSGSGRFIDVSFRSDGKIDFVQDNAGRRVSYAYDGQGNLSTVTDPVGRATRHSYNTGSFGSLLTQIADNWSRPITIIAWDLADRVTSYSEHGESYTYSYDYLWTNKTDSIGNTTSFHYGEGGLIDVRSLNGNNTATQYNPDGSIRSVTDAIGVTTSYTYDASGHVLTVTRSGAAASIDHEYVYDLAFPDKVASVTPKNPSTGLFDPNWQGWRYDYWAAGNPAPGAIKTVQRVKDDGITTQTVSSFEYDAHGRITKQSSATGATTDYVYDGSGNLSTVTVPANSDSGPRPATSYSSHDAVGRPLNVLDPNGKSTSYTYDPLGRVLTVTLPSVAGKTFTTTYSYDNFDSGTGLVFTHILDPNGKLTKLGYDEQGRLRKSIDAASDETLYGYTNDVLTSITDPNGNVTAYHYDALKRLDRTTFPDGATESYTYYADGLLQSKTDRKGQTISNEYDAFKRLKTKTYPDGKAITYTYTGQKLTQVVDTSVTPNETHTFGYDGSYRVQSNTEGPRGTLTYTYTLDDRVATMVVQGGPTQTYAYYPDGSLNTIQWSPVAGNFKYEYSPTGQYDTITFPNDQKRTYAYDDQGRLLTLSNTLGATNLASFSYGYDHDWASGGDIMLGQRTSMTATVPAQSLTNAQSKYSYDPLYQLVKAQYPAGAPFNGETHEWTYDALGNRLSSKVNGTGPTYTYLKNGTNPLNGQRLSSDGVNGYTWDPDGSNLTRTGSGGNYGFGYDVDNRLASITGAETATYTYDYQGRRTSKTEAGVTTIYLYDGLNPISETVSGAPTYVLNGPSIDEPLAISASGTISYLNADGLGSVIATNNAAGTVSHSLSFDAWGVPRNETGTRGHGFTYTGREVGVAGLHFYRARFMQPGVGRFSQEDPLRGVTAGLYTYAANSPLFFTDPFGLKERCNLKPNMLGCLQQMFTTDAGNIANVEVVSEPKQGGKWFATTRPNLIIAYVSCDEFFGAHEAMLEEYYHVLRQWNTGTMTRLGWLWQTATHGYDKNKFEVEAKAFAEAALPILEKCLKCPPGAP